MRPITADNVEQLRRLLNDPSSAESALPEYIVRLASTIQLPPMNYTQRDFQVGIPAGKALHLNITFTKNWENNLLLRNAADDTVIAQWNNYFPQVGPPTTGFVWANPSSTPALLYFCGGHKTSVYDPNTSGNFQWLNSSINVEYASPPGVKVENASALVVGYNDGSAEGARWEAIVLEIAIN